ncbi:sorbosone dehydrogenase family protein [Geobacillus sp. BMUD]|uniref:PQQ-dependent sugar dehydrogenase n=1 Tax=Geobacillus sp. BMUD TaxID=2508876 RepID=UPI001491F42C|nr:sorbosone dehydrogenase family protein [Geobacillus sp. BMUD]NNU85305.1 sorbosone dehydrogenase family protein [Geobacillus sp. BMUD]
MNQVLTFLFAILLISGCSASEKLNPSEGKQNVIAEQNQANEKGNEGEAEALAPIEEPEVIAENLEVPWSIEKEGDTFYLTERPGNIVKIENGEVERQKVELEMEISAASEAGLLGFVLAPDFSESNLAYAYYTYEDNSGQFNRIVSLRLDAGIWREEDVLLDRIPSAPWHSGGRLKIGPDGKLYAATGDAYDAEIAQDTDSLGGKILRMNLDGSIPSDNPFPNSYVYSYGHRNPQGLTWSPDGTLYASEHGNDANDEINRIEAGQNYGWPVIQGFEEQEEMMTPLFTSGDEATWAPSGMDYYNGKLYVAALRGSAVLEFNLETGEQRTVVTGLGRIRDVRIEDNYLYFISNNSDGRGMPQENDDKLYRITLPE